MRLKFVPLAILFALSLSPLAKADDIQQFYFSGTTFTFENSAGTASGNIGVDKTTGTVVDADLAFVDLYGLTRVIVTPTTGYSFINPVAGGRVEIDLSGGDPLGGYELFLPVASLVGYDGSPICHLGAVLNCGDAAISALTAPNDEGYREIRVFVNGSLSPTPEPSSLLLLATGALGLVGTARRRIFTRS